MKWMGLNELREAYLSFFESKGHLRLKSFPLIPQGDKSLLLINSGMAPMKKYFTGEVEPPRRRVTTCQKCIRTPDLERVGHTARHGTYFEMLGNFSFGDYFKHEAIAWAWEFLTEVLEIPASLLWPSVYENDEEAYNIWHDEIGVPPERIVRLGKEDNFWEHGTGPCGPCSEIYFDRGEKYGCGAPDCRPGCDCDRFMEIWNNVFSQFDNKGDGTYQELAQKNIDTGMGLDRLACVMQGVDNMFEVDTTRQIVNAVAAAAGKSYGMQADDDVSIRVVTDHVRAASFMICDGVLPSNEGRGYVLRRLLRRAARHGKLLGIRQAFLSQICEEVIKTNETAYPELREKEAHVKKVITLEEERFHQTIDAGLGMLNELIETAKKEQISTIAGTDAFRLYDTFGFPLDLTREIAAEAGLHVDEAAFAKLMQQQRSRAREARANISGWDDSSKNTLSHLPKTTFIGYNALQMQAKILAILTEDGFTQQADTCECTVVLDQTPFYGESGGQVGDTGCLRNDDASVLVTDCKKSDGIVLHICRITEGTLTVGDMIQAEVTADRREAIRKNHSAVHLLQSALRRVLGTHVEQAGSYVDEQRLRFDFTHYQAMTQDEIQSVEETVNAAIFAALPVETIQTDLENARRSGAMALFGEKYGKIVRMVKMGDISTELCGGTHVDNTICIGLFHILSESSVAAGVRRIEGVTAAGVLQQLYAENTLLQKTAQALKAQNIKDTCVRAQALEAELREEKRKNEQLQSKLAASQSAELRKSAVCIKNVHLITSCTDGLSLDAARALGDSLRATDAATVAVLLCGTEEKKNLLAVCGKDAIAAGADAGQIVRTLGKLLGGGGGGRPDSATAGIRDTAALSSAYAQLPQILQQMLH